MFLRKQFTIIKHNNKFIEILWGTPDHKRLLDCFEHIAFGIYRHHYGENFLGKVKPHLGFLHPTQQNQKTFKQFLKHKTEKELIGKEKFGSNQSVFFYQFTDPDKFGIFLIKLCFYENIDVLIAFTPEGAEPFNLGMELIKGGIHTIIHDDDKTFEFNIKKPPTKNHAQ